MNPFDMVVVVILVYFLITGLLRGSIREVTSIAALLGGFYFAYLYYESFATVFSAFLDTAYIREIAAFIVLFALFAIAVILIGILLRSLVKLVFLGFADRLLGGLLGGIKAVIVVSVLHFLALTFLPSGGAAIVAESRIAPAINSAASAIVYLVPEDVKQDLAARTQKLRWQWETRKTVPPREPSPREPEEQEPVAPESEKS